MKNVLDDTLVGVVIGISIFVIMLVGAAKQNQERDTKLAQQQVVVSEQIGGEFDVYQALLDETMPLVRLMGTVSILSTSAK